MFQNLAAHFRTLLREERFKIISKEKAEQVKAPEGLSSLSEIHMVDGEPFPAKSSSAFHQHHASNMHTKINKNQK